MPTVFMMSSPLATPSREEIEQRRRRVTATDYRWERCDIKSIALLGNVLLRQVAVDAGAAETMLFRDGLLTEAAASNVFVVEGDLLLAPPKSHLILPGITYELVLELAAASGVPHRGARSHRAGDARRRRALAHVVHQGSARDHDAERQAGGHRHSPAPCSGACTRFFRNTRRRARRPAAPCSLPREA